VPTTLITAVDLVSSAGPGKIKFGIWLREDHTLRHYQLCVPEVGGRVDWHAEDHEQTMLALGLSSKREITRTRIRVRTAMAA